MHVDPAILELQLAGQRRSRKRSPEMHVLHGTVPGTRYLYMFHNPTRVRVLEYQVLYVTDPHSTLHVLGLGPTWLYFYGSQPLWDILTLWDRFSRRRRVRHAGTPCLSLACTIQPLLAARVGGHPARRHEWEGRPQKNQPDSVGHTELIN